MSAPSQKPPKEKELMLAALELSPGERSAFVAEACANDPALNSLVQELLRNCETDAAFMAQPAIDLGTTTAMSSVQVGGQVGRYKLLEQIGEGGMGVVFVAEQLEPVRRKVALKVIKPGMDSKQVIARFEAERQALALMDHENIARVLDGGTTELGLPYFVMELVRGLPITKYCDQARSSTRQRLELFMNVCSAVQHAHQKGIIHRDIKPSNVMITLYDGQPIVKVIDFGVSKALHQQLSQQTVYTALNQVVGTPLYMSPEQMELSGLDIDTRTDVYSLGVLLYELLTGETPFSSERLLKSGFDEMRRIIREEEPQRPSYRITTLPKAELSTVANKRGLDDRSFTKSVKGELDWITLKAIEKDRSRRFESASALRADVQRFLNDEPVLACPPSLTYRLAKLARKHRGAMISISLVVAGLLIAVAGTSWQAIRATRAESQSDERLANLVIEQKKTSAALLVAEQAEEEQRRLRTEAEAFALREQDAANLQAELRVEAEKSKRDALWNLYVAKLYPMQKALEAKDFGRLSTLLDESVPSEAEPDFRDWEWYYLRDRVDSIFDEVTTDDAQPSGPLAWNPVANEFATYTAPHFIDIWNADTLKPVRRLDCQEPIAEMEWSPAGDMLAVGTNGGCELIVLNASVGSILWRSTPVSDAPGHQNRRLIIALSWHADNRQIAVANRFGEIAIVDLDANTTNTLRKPKKEELLGDLDWHPDGNRLAVGLRYGERVILDAHDKSVVQLEKLGLEVGEALAWNPTGNRLATSEGRAIRIADDKGVTLCELTGHSGAVDRLVWIDGTSLLSAGIDQTIRIWNTVEKSERCRLKIHDGPVGSIALGPRGSVLSAGDSRVRVSRFCTQQGETVSHLVTGDASESSAFATNSADGKNSIVQLKWNHHGTRIFAGGEISHGNSAGGSCGVWSSASLRLIHAYQTNDCKGSTWSTDGTQLLRAEYNRFQAEDFRTGIPIQSLVCDLRGDSAASWSPGNKYVTASGNNGSPLVRVAQNLEIVSNWQEHRGVPGNVIEWSSSGNQYISGGWDYPALFSMDGTVTEFPDFRAQGCFGIAWHPSDRVIALGSLNGKILIRDHTTLQVLAELRGHTSAVKDLAFSPNGRRLASASSDGTVRIWDFATGAELLQLTAEGVSGFSQVEWSPDGLQLAAGTTVREIVIFGSNETPLTPNSATSMENGAVIKELEQRSGKRFEWPQDVPKLAWRDPLTALKQCTSGLNGKIDTTRFNRQLAVVVAAHSSASEKFASLVQAWLILAEAHVDPDSAVFLVDRLLDELHANKATIDEERSLAFELEALTIAGQRASETGKRQLAQEYLQRAEQLGERLTRLYSNQATHWRNRISVFLLQIKSEVEGYKQALETHDEQVIAEMQANLHHLRAQLAMFYSKIPSEAFFFKGPTADIGQSDSWIEAVTQVELLHGLIPTFAEDWIDQYALPVQNGSANHYDFYQLALCHLVNKDPEAYRADCQKMLEKFDSSHDKLQLQFTAWTAAVAPGAMQDYAQVIELAKRAESSSQVPTYQLGALLYRAGEFEQARDILLKLAEAENPDWSPAYVWYFLAMTEHQLGNQAQSQTWFEKATDFTSLQFADEIAGKQSMLWNRRATLRLLDEEVKQLLTP